MIYWDNNATTPVADEVLAAMAPYWSAQFFNPSAAYPEARRVRVALDEAREAVAALVGAGPGEIIFTSGGTEATNAALSQFGNTLVLETEHPATLQSSGEGTRSGVQPNGLADEEAWRQGVQGRAGASFAWANHETGVIQPAERLISLAKGAGARVHVDIVQAAGKIPLNLAESGADFASLSAHKLHGPKGVGALYVARGAEWAPWMRGGSQEDYRRAGTENVPGIVGFGAAARLALAHADDYRRVAGLRDWFEAELKAVFPGDVTVHGEGVPRLPHVSNVRIAGCSAESLRLLFEAEGLIVSAGSACTSADPRPSHVLRAMGLRDSDIRRALRLSMARTTSRDEVREALEIVVRSVKRIRSVQSAHTGPVTVYRPHAPGASSGRDPVGL